VLAFLIVLADGVGFVVLVNNLIEGPAPRPPVSARKMHRPFRSDQVETSDPLELLLTMLRWEPPSFIPRRYENRWEGIHRMCERERLRREARIAGSGSCQGR